MGALHIQLATPQIVQWLQLVLQQLEDDNNGYDNGHDTDEEVGSSAVTFSASLIPTGVFSISSFNEYVQRGHHRVTYETQSSGPAHMLTWVSKCTGKL
jgi:hypothetical protein